MDNILIKMNMTQTETYQSYRYETEKKASQMLLVAGGMVLVVLSVFAVVGHEWLDLKIIGLVAGAELIAMIVYFFSVRSQLKEWKVAISMTYEYAVQNVKLSQECELLRENGEKVTYKVQNDKRFLFEENEQIVVVYIPDSKRVCIEKKSEWDKLYNTQTNN